MKETWLELGTFKMYYVDGYAWKNNSFVTRNFFGMSR